MTLYNCDFFVNIVLINESGDYMKYSLSIVLILANIISIFAQETKSYSLSYTNKDFDIVTDAKGLSMVKSNNVKVFLLPDKTLPAIPHTQAKILLPQDAEIVRVNLVSNIKDKIATCKLPNNPKISIVAYGTKPSIQPELMMNYNTDEQYPKEKIADYSISTIGGYKILDVTFSPFDYNAKVEELFLNQNIRIEVTINRKMNTKKEVQLAMRNVVKNIVINPEDLDILYSLNEQSVDRCGYLIITSNTLKPSFKKFAFDKALRGYDVKIMSVEDIYSNSKYSVYPDSAEKIKRYIYDFYSSTNNTAKYVLLGGDTEIVPTRYCTCFNEYVYDPASVNYSIRIPSDLYYVCFGGTFNWNKNGNNRYAEIKYNDLGHTDDEASLYPEMQIGRIPIRTATQFNNFYNKQRKYETDNYANSTNYYNKFLFGGMEVVDSFVTGESDAQHWGDSICNVISSCGYNAQIDTLFDTHSSFPNTFTRLQLRSALSSNAYNLIYIDTHGDYNGFQTESGIFNNTYANFSTTKPTSIITTSACNVNDFSREVSLGESFIRSNSNANISFWGNTNLGWSAGIYYFRDTSPTLIGDFYHYLVTGSSHHIGDVIESAKANLDRDHYVSGRWLALSQTLSGDPELHINISKPRRINPVKITIADTKGYLDEINDSCDYYLLLGGLSPQDEGYMDDYTHLHALMMEPGDSEFFIWGNFVLGIAQDEYVPFRSDVDGFYIARIQDQSMDDFDLKAQNFEIGINVDQNQPSGPVSISTNKNATLTVGNILTIYDNFECPLGATFDIKTQ